MQSPGFHHTSTAPTLEVRTKNILRQVTESAGDVMDGWQTVSKKEVLCVVSSIPMLIAAVL